MDFDEFAEDGYLAEVNRRFLHPLGLALAVLEDPLGRRNLEILDARDDPTGWFFDDTIMDEVSDKARRLRKVSLARHDARMAALGYWIQPINEASNL